VGNVHLVDSVVVYHNPSCSKSRGALEVLSEQGVDANVVEYLKAPPDRATLVRIVDAIPNPPADLVRKDKRFKELGLDAADYTTKAAVVKLLLEHPELMERPVVFVGERAVIARPPELVTDLVQGS
jgi:arsenate reductase (glutaredoxin)